MWFATVLCVLIFVNLATPAPTLDSLKHLSNRIVGGSLAAEGTHPFMVGLSTGILIKTFVCGGSLIATRTVLTAAHCVDAVYNHGDLSISLRVVVGTNKWNQRGLSYSVLGNVTHNKYSPTLVKNDIAVLYTSSAVLYSDFVQPIVLSYDYIHAGIVATAAGWGRIWYPFGPISDYLLELTVTTISEERCVAETLQASRELKTHGPQVDPRIELCVYRSPYHGMCKGDSGGALVRQDRGTQIGVMSWGFPCARGAPDIFVRISAFEMWIAMYTRY